MARKIPARMTRDQERAATLRTLAQHGITPDYLMREVDKAYKKGRADGARTEAEYYLTTCYAAAVLAAHEVFGFGRERCLRLLRALDQQVTYSLTSQELAEEAVEKLGIRINFKGALDEERIGEAVES